jgi:hypothetical protein
MLEIEVGEHLRQDNCTSLIKKEMASCYIMKSKRPQSLRTPRIKLLRPYLQIG